MYPNGQSPPPPQQMPQQPPQAPQGPGNAYDFLSQQPDSSSKLPIDLSTTKSKIIVAGGLLAIIFILFIIFSAIFGGGDKEQTQKYLTVAKSQTEIIRLASLADENAGAPSTKELALTAKFAMTSSQGDMTAILGKRGINQKSLSKQLTASVNSQSDQLLEEASQNNRYDETVLLLIFQELEEYQKELQFAASGATKTELETLTQANEQAEILLASKPTESPN